MMDSMYFMPILMGVGIVSFLVGYAIASEPTEDEMFNRLVRFRAERELQKGERSKLEHEVAAASEKVVQS